MNKTVIAIGYFALGAVGLLAVVAIAIFRPDATATIIQYVGTVLGIASTATVTFYMLGKQNEAIAKVDAQTNGTLSELRAELAEKDRQLIAIAKAKTD